MEKKEERQSTDVSDPSFTATISTGNRSEAKTPGRRIVRKARRSKFTEKTYLPDEEYS